MKNNSNERGTSTVLIILAIVVAAVGSAVGTYLVTSREKEGVSKATFEDRVSSLESSISKLQANIDSLSSEIEGLAEKERVSNLKGKISDIRAKVNNLDSTVSDLTKEKEWRNVLDIYSEEAETGKTETISIPNDEWRIQYIAITAPNPSGPNPIGSFAFKVINADTGKPVSMMLGGTGFRIANSIDINQEGTFYIDIKDASHIKEYRMIVQVHTKIR